MIRKIITILIKIALAPLAFLMFWTLAINSCIFHFFGEITYESHKKIDCKKTAKRRVMIADAFMDSAFEGKQAAKWIQRQYKRGQQ